MRLVLGPRRPLLQLNLVHLFVVPKWQKRGIGSAAVRALQAHVCDDGHMLSITLDCSPSCVGFYQKLGFYVTPTPPGSDDVGLTFMQWDK